MLHVLPDRTADAAENMALDFLMLQRYPEPGHFRLRHYEWRRPACTFGYSQKIAFVRKELPDPDLDVTRRATGGGIVDHTADWTFCLVMGAVACMFMPVGTVLGVFTIVVLMKPSVKELFGEAVA